MGDQGIGSTSTGGSYIGKLGSDIGIDSIVAVAAAGGD
jgi:hypothetical protein